LAPKGLVGSFGLVAGVLGAVSKSSAVRVSSEADVEEEEEEVGLL
jgi:hypothetical protein